MWMIRADLMCTKHINAEHNEIHMFVGIFKKKRQVTGYCTSNQLEIKSLVTRHNEIVNEMIDRGYNHNTPLSEIDIDPSYLNEEVLNYTINREESMKIIRERCQSCNENITLFFERTKNDKT